eukprot:1046991-Pyramimonas_sp.AAC.1
MLPPPAFALRVSASAHPSHASRPYRGLHPRTVWPSLPEYPLAYPITRFVLAWPHRGLDPRPSR